MSAFAPKKGGAGLSLPSSSSADAQRAVNKAIEDLAEKYGVDLPAGDAGAGAGPGVEERYDAAAEAFFAAENDAAVANKKRIVSQAAFDEVVNENIEDFEMDELASIVTDNEMDDFGIFEVEEDFIDEEYFEDEILDDFDYEDLL